ncbi:MAG: uracil-DNA glycosylase [Litoreibacter sp.]|nr:uracil-DNA glycosylase [Litoreibacter sp.]
MESGLSYAQAKALLEWQIDLGATEAIAETPVNRYEAPAKQPKPTKTPVVATPVEAPKIDPVQIAREAAQQANSLDELKAAMAAFEHCELKRGARNLVFSDADPSARVMIVGEAPGRDEDIQGKPFVGRAGQLLDAMFSAIKHGRAEAEHPLYITNVMPWRPPNNREPSPEEMAMMMPFLERHIALAEPEILVLMGNVPCQAVLGRKGITKLRGTWSEALGLPVLPMCHPAYLLRQPLAKREAWADLLSLQARLRG